MNDEKKHIRWFAEISNDDVAVVGGKNASLGEMISALKSKGVEVPDGFATTSTAYRTFLEENRLVDEIVEKLQHYHNQKRSLSEAGEAI